MSKPPPIIFMHVPRTGGTSTRQMLMEIYGEENIGRPGEYFERSVVNNPFYKRFDAWMGHFRFGLHEYLDEPVPYMTVIRDPIERLQSQYCKQNIRKRKGWTPLELALNKPRRCWNVLTRMFCGVHTINDLKAIADDALDIAYENAVKHFVHIGDTAELDRTARWLRDNLGWSGELAPHINTSNRQPISDEERGEAEASEALSFDIALYHRLKELQE